MVTAAVLFTGFDIDLEYAFEALGPVYSRVPLRRGLAFAGRAGVTCWRRALLGANTPWNRVRFTSGFGTKAVRQAIKSHGSKVTWVVLSR